MALKFRRGTTAQKSGSLAFGEPYVNTTLGTLQIGGPDGDITLGSTGTGSTGTFGAISGSGLDITGNANIAGNLTLGGQLTIGDNTSDTVNVVASLSSSLIPETSNTYNLGSATKFWKEIYVSTGSIKFVDNSGNVVSTLSSNASGDFNIDGEFSASSITGIGNVSTYSSSVASRLVAAESFSSSLDSTFATDASVTIVSASAAGAFASASAYSASAAVIDNTQTTNITANSASAANAFASASAYSSSQFTRDANQDTLITANSASAAGAFASASAYSASIYTRDANQDTLITNNSASAAGAFASASAYSASAAVVAITNANSAAGAFASASAYSASAAVVAITNANSAAGAFASASAYSASAVTTYAKLAVANTFTANQIVSGSITATGDVVAFSTSDRRHKNNIVLISDALSKVTKLNGVTWEWNEDVDDATKETPKTGLIAQEVQEVLPEVVKERADGFLALDYSKTIGLLVEAIKEQQTQIHSLTLEIEKLKKDNSL